MTVFLHITISQKTGCRVGERKASIYREVKIDYKEARRLNDLPKVTAPVPGKPRIEGRSADSP